MVALEGTYARRHLHQAWDTTQALTDITEDPDDAATYPSQRPGVVPADWLTDRQACTATLSGVYCLVTDPETLPTLRPLFLPVALGHGLADLDAGTLRLSAPRALTQQIAAWLYDLHHESSNLVDGVQFESRHGDGLTLWAIFERHNDQATSAQLVACRCDWGLSF